MSPNLEEIKKPAAESAPVETTAPGGKEELNNKLEEKAAQLRAVYGEAEQLTKSVEATEAAVKDIPHLSAALEIIKSQLTTKQAELAQAQSELAAAQAELDALPESEEVAPATEAVAEQKIIDIGEPAVIAEATQETVITPVQQPAAEELATTIDAGWEESTPTPAEATPVKTPETTIDTPAAAMTEAPQVTTEMSADTNTEAKEVAEIDPADADKEHYVTAEVIKGFLDKNPLNTADAVAKLSGRISNMTLGVTSMSGLEAINEALNEAEKNEELQTQCKEKYNGLSIQDLKNALHRQFVVAELRLPSKQRQSINEALAALKDEELPTGKRSRKLAQLIGRTQHLDQATQNDIYKTLGPRYINELKNTGGALKDFTRTSATDMSIGFALERADPKMADGFHEFMLDMMAENLNQNESSNRSEIYLPGANACGFYLPATMGAVYKRIAAGETLPPAFQEKLIAILKAWQSHPDAKYFDPINKPSFIRRNMARILGAEPSPQTVEAVAKAIAEMTK